MTTLLLYGGPLKRSIIQRASAMLGQSVTEYEITPEEYVQGLQSLNDQMATFPGIPYNFPLSGDGNPEDESGLSNDDVLGTATLLAQTLSQTIGKQFSMTASQARAVSAMRSKYQTVPLQEMGRQTIRGVGNRYWSGQRPFFTVADISDAEVPQ